MENLPFLNLLRSDRNKAFAYLYKEGLPFIKNLAFNNNLTLEDAKDILQDAIIAFDRNSRKSQFKLTVKPTTYLFQIVKLRMYNHLRDRNVSVELPINITIHEDDSSVEFEENYSAMQKLLGVVFNGVGKKCMDILKDFYYYKLSMEEVAKNNGYVSSDSAKSQKAKCMSTLRELYNNHINE